MTTDLNSILARLKKPGEIINEDRNRTHDAWDEWCPFPEEAPMVAFASALLDLVQRQDERIAGLEGVIRAQEAMIQSALEPVGVNGPPWDHHAAEDAADLILALRAERDALLKEAP